MPFSYATPGTGPSAGGIGWFNFGNLSLAPGQSALGLTGTLNDGTTLTFDIAASNVSGANRTFNAVPTPTYVGTFFGNEFYQNLAGNTALLVGGSVIPGSNAVTLSNIVVKDAGGNLIPNYTFLVADAESTGLGEIINVTTNGGNWQLFATLGSGIGSDPTLTGIGTQAASITGNADPNPRQNDYVLTTLSPTQLVVDINLTSTNGGQEAFAIGLATTRVTVQKNVGARIDPSDQFVLNLTGTPSAQATTAGAAQGIQTQTASAFVIPGNTYTINESIAPGSASPLSAYTQVVSAANATPAGTIPPTGNLPINFTPALGDDVTYTILNAAPETYLKTVDKAFADIGDLLTYTVSVTNPNNIPLTNTIVTDPTPAGTTYANNLQVNVPFTGTDPATGITLTSIPANSTATVSWQVQVNTAPPIPNPVTNIATITMPNGMVVNTNSVSTQVNHAAVSATKMVDNVFAKPGDVLTYTIMLNNMGNTAANNVVLTDAVPAGTTFVPGSVTGATGTPPTLTLANPIPVAGTATVSFQVIVGNTLPTPNPIPNSASAAFTYTVDPANPNGANGTAASNVANTQVNSPVITTTKTVDKAFASPGDTLTYTITLQNSGNVAANNVVLTDQVPAGTTFVPGSVTGATGTPPTLTLAAPVAAGGTATVTFQVLVGNTIPNTNPVSNTATANYTYTVNPANPNGAKGTSTSEAATTQINQANVSVVKTSSPTAIGVNGIITYTLTLNNTGNVSANNVVLTDAVPAGTTFVPGSVTGATGVPPTLTLNNPVPAGGNATVTFQVQVGNTVPTPNPIPNTANANFTYTADPANPNGASGTAQSNAVSTPVNNAALTTTKTVDKAFAMSGDVLTYTITLNNTGNVTANNVVLTDAVPAGTAFVPGSVTGATGTPPTLTLTSPIAAGQTSTVTFQVKVGDTLPNPNPVSNTVAAAFTFTIDPANPNGATGTSQGGPANTQINEPVISVVKTATPVAIDKNGIITYTLTLNNTGNVAANNVVITDAIPSGMTFVPGSVTGATGVPPTLTLNAAIPEGGSAVVTYQIQAGDTLPTPNPVPNTASAGFTFTVDPANPNGASGTAGSNTTTTPVNNATVITTKTADKAYVAPGDVLTYTLNLQNTGNVPADNVIITDAVPSGTTFIPGTVTGATGTPPTLTLLASIPAGGTATVTFQVLVNQGTPVTNPIPNTASTAFNYTVDPANPDGATGTSASNTINTIVSFASVTATKTADATFVQPGDVITYTITLQNSGNATANNVVVTDPVPAGTTFVPGSVTGATGTPPTLTVQNPIPAGGTATISYQIKVGATVPGSNPIPNTADAAYAYTVDPARPNAVSSTAVTNTLNVQVNTAKISLTKSADKAVAYIGDVITYQIAAHNTGNVPADNVVITDLIPIGTQYVPGSLTVGVPFTGTPAAGITLTNPVAPGAVVPISFQIMVMDIPNPNPIVNTASAVYSYTVNPDAPDGVSGTTLSNSETTVIFRNNYGTPINDIIQSVALEEAALANLVNAEGAKIQAMVAMGNITAQELLCVNKSVADMLESIAMLENVLKQKLNALDCQINGTTC